MTLTNPGGIGTVASVPRLMPGQGCIIATGAIVLPPGLRGWRSRGSRAGHSKVMTMTSTYDHRVIQGAESGAFLRPDRAAAAGRGRLLRERVPRASARAPCRDAGRAGCAAPAAAPVTAPPSDLVSKEMLYHVQAATSLVKAHRMHGHLAARLDPLGSEPIGDPALEPETVGLTPEVMAQIPARGPAHPGPGRDARRGAAAPARDLLRHDRLRDRAHLRPPAARVAAAADRVGRVPAPAAAGGEAAGPEPPDRGRGARDLHPQGLPGREELLDRGPRHADPDARRDVRAGRAREARARR